jgi:MYXO-CTERM domain-containing protein
MNQKRQLASARQANANQRRLGPQEFMNRRGNDGSLGANNADAPVPRLPLSSANGKAPSPDARLPERAAWAIPGARGAGFDGSSSELVDLGSVSVVNNAFALELEAFSATHVVLTTDDPPDITGVGGAGGSGGVGNTAPSSTGGRGGSGSAAISSNGPSDGDDSGCGCRVARAGDSAGSVLAVLVATWLLRRRRGTLAQIC